MTLQDRWFHAKRHAVEFVEDQWFDRTHHVRTAGDVSLVRAGIRSNDTADSELYVPARPAHIREALNAAPVADFSEYTYIDLGSGKGRTLFVAAEFGFKRIVGVEFSEVLHQQACSNALAFRHRGRRGDHIACAGQNAKAFEFPEEPTVLYMFNPFGAQTMQVVLNNLEQSLVRAPRHVVVVLLWPRCGDQVARVPGMHEVCRTAHHQIFEVNAPQCAQGLDASLQR